MNTKHLIVTMALASVATIATAGTSLAVPISGAVMRPAPAAQPASAMRAGSVQRPVFPYAGPLHEVRGFIRAVSGTSMILQSRRGNVNVDLTWTLQHSTAAPLVPNRPVRVRGALVGNKLVAYDVEKDHSPPQYWPADH